MAEKNKLRKLHSEFNASVNRILNKQEQTMKYNVYWFKDHTSEIEFFMQCDAYAIRDKVIELYLNHEFAGALNLVLFAYLKPF